MALAVACFAFLYTCLRAYLLSITHDEALTYTYFAHLSKSYGELFNYTIPTTNHHLLNSVMIKWLTDHLGNSEFVIRLPALLGHAFFLAGTFLTLRLFLSGKRLLIGSLVTFLNPFLLDYFSCARGYALALGFFSFALYFSSLKIQRGMQNQKHWELWAAFIALSFSALSNFAFLTVFAVFAIILAMSAIHGITSGKINLKQFLIHTVLPIVLNTFFLFWICAEPIRKLKEANEFYHGGDIGFVHDTLQTVILGIARHPASVNPNFFLGLSYLLSFTVIIALGVCSFRITTKKECKPFECLLWLATSSATAAAALTIMQHFLLGTAYPHDRAAFYYVPLLTMSLLLLWQYGSLISGVILRTIFNTIFAALFFALSIHFISSLNMTHFHFNPSDAHIKEVMLQVKQIGGQGQFPPDSKTIGNSWTYEPSINYYKIRYQLNWLNFATRKGPDGNYDFYYIHQNDGTIIRKYGLRLIKLYKLKHDFEGEAYFAVSRPMAELIKLHHWHFSQKA